ncbi:uncharacterized protein LOC129860162 isoform X4 [Salvelinus fontinalis]|uniref:uncharacterized protein LOC129860162 isoform X4 n=1 Tax=Salvelinus fontinalis TaxID=8038 RepID=UPI00248583C4|nr:uncharacterized protein LOC129860162 isoform X4 [Salvelinus fontinalis]
MLGNKYVKVLSHLVKDLCAILASKQRMRPVTSTVRTNPACLSPSTLSPNLQSLGPDCDSGAQFAPQDPEMASVKLEDCSQTLELNVNIKDEEEEEKIGNSVSHGTHSSPGAKDVDVHYGSPPHLSDSEGLRCLLFGVLGWVSVQHFEISADVRRAI